jgi:hypothetical protein
MRPERLSGEISPHDSNALFYKNVVIASNFSRKKCRSLKRKIGRAAKRARKSQS